MKKPLTVLVIAGFILALLIFVPDADANDRRDHRPEVSQRHSSPSRFHAVGHQMRDLPAGHARISIGGEAVYYHGGAFYRQQGSAYVVVSAPISARVTSLPAGFVSFWIGSRRYYHVNATYFLLDTATQEYIVVAEPDGATDALATTESSEQLFVYPGDGQSDEQVRRDRYECYVWASQQSGFDPALLEQPSQSQADYDRALTACLEGRGYTVK